jgi:diguanylate cyclase (GGDEF)-like protein
VSEPAELIHDEAGAGRPLQALIVEDSEDDVLLVVRVLTRGGYAPRYRQVATAEAMRRALASEPWDIVIADHNMPQFNSTAALEVLKESGRDIPFIIVSGSIGEAIAVEAMKAGAHDYVLKDNLARLVPAVDRELREATVRHERRQAEELLRHQASHDALTGLINRLEFERRLARALSDTRRLGRRHALCYMDLDQFKVVNDVCGHGAGDELLKQLVVQLRGGVRETDTLARLGGDEFGLLLENCSLESAERAAQTLLERVGHFRFAWLGKTFEVGVSMGLVAIDASSGDVASLLSAADVACYTAKDLGRHRIHVYRTDDIEVSKRRGEMDWVARIKHAMRDGRFRLFAQPIVGARDGRPHDREVLLRLLGEQGELIMPEAFVPAAERYGLMPALDRWVVERVVATCGRRRGDLAPCGYSINLSGASVNDDGFLRFLQGAIEGHDLAPSAICFEITETAAIVNLTKAAHLMSELKSLGCRFALDDFGSGLSSFSYLKQLPVDYLKIAGNFVRGITEDPVDGAMVEAINKIGHVMGLRTIAEYVEREVVLERVREIGVDYVQGNAIAPPTPLLTAEVGGGDGRVAGRLPPEDNVSSRLREDARR